MTAQEQPADEEVAALASDLRDLINTTAPTSYAADVEERALAMIESQAQRITELEHDWIESQNHFAVQEGRVREARAEAAAAKKRITELEAEVARRDALLDGTMLPNAPEIPRAEWEMEIAVERGRQRDKGYTAEHDRAEGAAHLIMWSDEYARRGERIKAQAITWALYDLLAQQGNEAAAAEAIIEKTKTAIASAVDGFHLTIDGRAAVLGALTAVSESPSTALAEVKAQAEQAGFEEGARAAAEAFDLYFRNEDEYLFIGVATERENGEPGYEWKHLTDADMESFQEGAVQDALRDRRLRIAREQEADRG